MKIKDELKTGTVRALRKMASDIESGKVRVMHTESAQGTLQLTNEEKVNFPPHLRNPPDGTFKLVVTVAQTDKL